MRGDCREQGGKPPTKAACLSSAPEPPGPGRRRLRRPRPLLFSPRHGEVGLPRGNHLRRAGLCCPLAATRRRLFSCNREQRLDSAFQLRGTIANVSAGFLLEYAPDLPLSSVIFERISPTRPQPPPILHLSDSLDSFSFSLRVEKAPGAQRCVQRVPTAPGQRAAGE